MEKWVYGIILFIAIIFLSITMDDQYQKDVRKEVESRGFELCSCERRMILTPWYITKNYYIYRFTYQDHGYKKIGWVRFGFGTEWKWDTQQ